MKTAALTECQGSSAGLLPPEFVLTFQDRELKRPSTAPCVYPGSSRQGPQGCARSSTSTWVCPGFSSQELKGHPVRLLPFVFVLAHHMREPNGSPAHLPRPRGDQEIQATGPTRGRIPKKCQVGQPIYRQRRCK